MKKLFTLALFSLVGLTVKGQGASTPTVVVDTVHYYFNKYYFKTGVPMESFKFYKSPASTSTLVSHVGVMFENNEPLDIFGLEGFLTRDEDAVKATINVHLYLCNVANGLPVLPPIDSVMIAVTGDTTFVKPVGGNFANDTVHTVTGDFAVLARNMSPSSGDTVRIMRTAGVTATASLPQGEEGRRNSDGYGFVRIRQGGSSSFQKTTDLNIPGFGLGTDYEFCLAPRVQYTITADHAVDPIARKPLCMWEPMTLTNLSSKRISHRMYNLVEFCRRWNYNPPFNPNTLQQNGQDVFPNDSAVSWYFAPEDGGQHDPRIFLPYNSSSNQIVFYTDSSSYTELGGDSTTCFDTNEFRTRFKTMAIYGRGEFMAYNDTFIICTSYCGRPYVVSVGSQKGFEQARVYPNPSNGAATISGLSAGSLLQLYSLQGQLLHTQQASSDKVTLDLTSFPAGTYLLRLSDVDRSRTFRIIKE